jgi:hypothetical protein
LCRAPRRANHREGCGTQVRTRTGKIVPGKPRCWRPHDVKALPLSADKLR